MNELNYNQNVKPQMAIGSLYYPSNYLLSMGFIYQVKLGMSALSIGDKYFIFIQDIQKNYQQNLLEIGDKDLNKK